MSITITAKALREALEFCNPDGPEDEDQMETELTIWMRETDEVSDEGEPLPRGLYCHLSEYPEEGCIPLFEVTDNALAEGAEPLLAKLPSSAGLAGETGGSDDEI